MKLNQRILEKISVVNNLHLINRHFLEKVYWQNHAPIFSSSRNRGTFPAGSIGQSFPMSKIFLSITSTKSIIVKLVLGLLPRLFRAEWEQQLSPPVLLIKKGFPLKVHLIRHFETFRQSILKIFSLFCREKAKEQTRYQGRIPERERTRDGLLAVLREKI